MSAFVVINNSCCGQISFLKLGGRDARVVAMCTPWLKTASGLNDLWDTVISPNTLCDVGVFPVRDVDMMGCPIKGVARRGADLVGGNRHQRTIDWETESGLW